MDRPIRFTIRQILVATAVAALAFGWLVDHGRLMIELDRCRESNVWLRQEASELARTLDNLQRQQAMERLTLPGIPQTKSDLQK
jgi:hypothetical protein